MKVWFALALSSLRNRALATALTVFSIGLSVALLLGIERLRLGARESFSNTISQVDLVVGARASPLQLLLYSVFHIGEATNNVSYKSYEHFKNHPAVAWTIPFSLGDSHEGYRVVATDENFYREYRYRVDETIQFSAGRAAQDVFDVVLGADVARNLHYEMGRPLVLSHGLGEGFQKHEDKPFRVVGILQKTATPIDRALYITLEGMEAIHMDWQNGAPPLPGQEIKADEIRKSELKVKQLTSFLLRSKSRISTLRLQREIDDFENEALVAVIPGVGLAKLWELLSYGEDALRIVSLFVVVVGFIGMLISIYTTLNERRREIAILRALGTAPRQIFFLLLLESGLLTTLGIVFGVVLSYTLLFLSQSWLVNEYGLYIPIQALALPEYIYMGILWLAGLLVGILPAARAYRYMLADGLTIRS